MKTGFDDLDSIMQINKGDLIIVASRPAMGKSTLALNILSNVAIKEKKPVLMFNLESSKENIINKLIISNSMVEADKFEIYDKYQKGKIMKPELIDDDWDRIFYGLNILKDAPIFIDTTAPYTIEDICKKSRELKLKENIELIIIDYLQLIQFDKSKALSRDNETREILKELNILAKELNISEHERVKIVSQNGVTSEFNVVYSDTVKKEHLYAPMHYIETNSLTPSLYDPYSKEPSYKTVAVNIIK